MGYFPCKRAAHPADHCVTVSRGAGTSDSQGLPSEGAEGAGADASSRYICPGVLRARCLRVSETERRRLRCRQA